jgi:hypothetical protein
MRRIVFVLTVVALTLALAAAPGRAQAAQPMRDAFGRTVPTGSGRPALVFYTNRHTRDELEKYAFQAAFQLRALRPIVVVHVDLRDVPGMFKGMARREVVKAHRESIAEMASLFRRQGLTPPADLDESLFMIPSTGGEAHAALGLRADDRQVIAHVVGQSGQVLGRGSVPSDLPRLARTLGPASTYARR